MTITPDEILSFWFGDIADDGGVVPDRRARWWKKDPEFDAELEARFGEAIEAALAGKLDSWRDDPRSALALILLLDQFTRNTRRETPGAFAGDARALEIAQDLYASKKIEQLRSFEAYFATMPFMHSESREMQAQSVARFEALANEAEPGASEATRAAIDYAIRHREIVDRFGRFPHRNAWLGRESSEEERAFLQQPGSSF